VTASDAISIDTIPAREYGYFRNPDGYDLRPTRWIKILGIPYKQEYEFSLLNPAVEWVDTEGNVWRTGAVFSTDMGSIPRLVQLAIPKDRFIGFYFHDFGYRLGYLYRNGAICKLSRRQIDGMLHDMILSDPEPGYAATADVIWAAVRSCGWVSF